MKYRFLNKVRWFNFKKDLTELIKGISSKDVLIFLIFPVLVTLLMFLPPTIRESLSLHIYNPKWWQFFTSSFIHKDFFHLRNNIQLYLIFGIILFIFADKINAKKKLFFLFLLVFVALPIISSIIEVLIYPIFVPRIETSQGSSGLVSAISGFLPMFWIYYFSKKLKTNLMNINFLAISTLYIILLGSIIYFNKKIIFILLIILLFIILNNKDNFKLISECVLKESKDNVIFYFLIILIPLFFMTVPFFIFPTKIIQGNGLVDVFIHYISSIFGVVISFIFLKRCFNKEKLKKG